MTFATAESSREFDENDLRTAEDLARRVVIAIENANLLAMLKDGDRHKDEFLAMLAHELRNPLAPIRNAAEILKVEAPPNGNLRRATTVIERQIDQMNRLIDDLLDVSRITRGKIELRKEHVDLASVVNHAVDASAPLIERGGHRLHVTLPAEPVYFAADPARLSQVLANLLNNAAKYTNQGGTIELSASRDGDSVVLRVRDNGIGIPPGMTTRIFELFTQVDRSLERSEGGLGIGLTLVQRIVEMHGGVVECHSAGPGTGSEFTIRLPVVDDVRRPRETGNSAVRIPTPVPRRVLVVDNNHDAADSMAMLLRMTGNHVHTAYDGDEALRAVSSFEPEIVLLDIGLPTINGYEVARQIRTQDGGSKRLLIAMTGWGQAEDRRRSKEAGFDEHLTKPVEFGVVQRIMSWAAPR
jgi:CheY-like chemotaxis protein/two-component sensor histidine kinase